MLMRTLKMSFWVCYDHLGKLLTANLLVASVILIPASLCINFLLSSEGDSAAVVYASFFMLAIVFIVVLPALYAGLLFMIKELIEKHDGSLKTMITGIIRFGGRAVLISIFYFASSLGLLISMVYYGIVSHGVFPFGFLVLGVAAFWALVFLLLTAIAVFPVLVNKDAGIVETIRTACLLVLDNPIFFAGLALSLVFVIAFGIMPPVAMFVAIAFFAAIVGSAYEMLSRKYAALQAQTSMPNGSKKKIAIDFSDGNDEYLSRGLRDFLFPWKE